MQEIYIEEGIVKIRFVEEHNSYFEMPSGEMLKALIKYCVEAPEKKTVNLESK